MSRVFDALRKSAEEHGKSSSTAVPEAGLGPVGEPVGLEQTLDTGQIPVVHSSAMNGNSPATIWHEAGQETFRLLRHRLDLIRRRRPLKTILVTSSVPKEGKTVVAVNLAIMLARATQQVLLVDGDLRNPNVHSALGVQKMAGLGDLLEERIGLNEVLRRVEPYGLYFLPAGSARQNPGETLGRPAARQCLALCARQFEWIVVDSPPLIPFVDAHHLASVVDGLVMVVRQGFTPRSTFRQALAGLDMKSVVGTVLNSTRDEQLQYYRYYRQQES